MATNKLEIPLFFIFFLGISILAFFVFQPFFHILILGAVLAILLEPIYKKLLHYFHGKGKTILALVVIALVLVFLILPLLFFVLQILGHAQNFFALSHDSQNQYIDNIQQAVEKMVGPILPNFSFSISEYTSRIISYILSNLGGLLSQSAYILLQILFLLFAFFLFLRDGDAMVDSLIALSPFTDEQNKKITNSLKKTISSVIRGTLFIGLIRLVLLTAVFYFLSIPNAMFWGIISGIVGAIPGVGTPFVVIPAILYLAVAGNILPAILMGLFGILIIFFVDNWLSTYFFGKGLAAPSIFVLFSILGGVIFFGPLGFIFGPIILSLFISALDIYKILILEKN